MASHNDDGRNVRPRISEESDEKPKIWKLTEISESSQCRSSKLPENLGVPKIFGLIYMTSGNAILALASNVVHLLWKWQRNEYNSSGMVNGHQNRSFPPFCTEVILTTVSIFVYETASVSPQLWQPSRGILMTNDVLEPNHEEVVSCFAFSKNDSYVISTSGGKISLLNMWTFEAMIAFMPPPPAATYIAFYPQDNNSIAIGMDDSTILIYNVRAAEVKSTLKGHSKRITGLAFSCVLDVLVSSGADSQLCLWSTGGWEMQRARSLQLQGGLISQSDTSVQFHLDQTHVLVVHEAQIIIYETMKLECLRLWVLCECAAPISHATFSCDSQLIYASFLDATVCVFTAGHLHMQCRIIPSAYLSPNISNSNIHPVVVVAYPKDPNQFALGLSDGGVHILEPLESEGKRGIPPPLENGSATDMPTSPSVGASCSDQAPSGQRSP